MPRGTPGAHPKLMTARRVGVESGSAVQQQPLPRPFSETGLAQVVQLRRLERLRCRLAAVMDEADRTARLPADLAEPLQNGTGHKQVAAIFPERKAQITRVQNYTLQLSLHDVPLERRELRRAVQNRQ